MTTRPGSQADAGPPAPQPAALRAVFLVGFMGAGKTSVGEALGRLLGWPFEDLDDRVQAREGRTIQQIFEESGEAAFRRAENTALRELLAEHGDVARVVALGGGAFVQPENAALLQRQGLPAVFLDAAPEELFERCRQDQQPERPLRRDLEQFRRLYDLRRPHYLKASLRVDTSGKDVESVAEEIVSRLGLR